jgi:exopolysaccharide biosynthesis polyprenyl glycosylphosphotransferase
MQQPRPHGGSVLSESTNSRRARRVRSIRTGLERLFLPLASAALVAVVSNSTEALVISFFAFLATSAILHPNPPWLHLVRVPQLAFEAIPPAAALALLAILSSLQGFPQMSAAGFIVVLVLSTLLGFSTSLVGSWISPAPTATRIAVIGSFQSALELSREVRLARVAEFLVVGRIAYKDDDDTESAEVPLLGSLDKLDSIVAKNKIGLLVMTSTVPRFRVFEEVANTCLHLPVRLMELTGLYEYIFGHVPVAEINAAWFQYIMHPRYSPITPHAKRALDLIVAITLGVVFLPVIAVCAMLIRRDGGPALFRQTRIGESGKPLEVYKLRTMKVDAGLDSQWASPGDPRITRIGAILRKLHLDELPQIVNVIRGEMSMVGPRPEQPEFVERLEGMLPFYSRRHLIKPGITGWAQVRCGYAGSDVGSAWKLCHDLYYLKYRSTMFDLSILAETFAAALGNRYHVIDAGTARFVHDGTAGMAQQSLAKEVINS